jgi:hypothetical protein
MENLFSYFLIFNVVESSVYTLKDQTKLPTSISRSEFPLTETNSRKTTRTSKPNQKSHQGPDVSNFQESEQVIIVRKTRRRKKKKN